MPITRIDVRKLVENIAANYVLESVVGICIDVTAYGEDTPENRFAWMRSCTAQVQMPVRIVMPCSREYVYFCLGDLPLEDIKCGCGKDNEWVVRWYTKPPKTDQGGAP